MSKIILLNKPFNMLSQFTDQRGRPTLADYLPHRDCYPAGRLDYDSEGLLLLTDDGGLQHQISHPSSKQPKIYWVQVEGRPTDQQLTPLREGVSLNDGACLPARVKIIQEPKLWARQPPVRERKNIPTSWLEIGLKEGRNRQVRRMTAAIGFPTLRLVRSAIGDWQLDDLQPGQWRELAVHASRATGKPVKRSTRGRRRL